MNVFTRLRNFFVGFSLDSAKGNSELEENPSSIESFYLSDFVPEIVEQSPLADDDLDWIDWVNSINPGWDQLSVVVAGNFRDIFKKRALYVLLSPSKESIRFYWNEGGDCSFRFRDWQNQKYFSTLTPDLALYAADLVKGFLTAVVQTGYNKNTKRAFEFYKDCILKLMPLLSKEDRSILFGFYQLPTTILTRDEVFGHLRDVLRSKIELEYKISADAKVREIVREELSDESRFMEIFGAYCSAIEASISFDGPKVPDSEENIDFFADQLLFITDIGKEFDCMINVFHLSQYLRFFSGERYKKLRLEISKYCFLKERDRGPAYDKHSLEAAEVVLDEFGELEFELRDALLVVIQEAERGLEEENLEQRFNSERMGSAWEAMKS